MKYWIRLSSVFHSYMWTEFCAFNMKIWKIPWFFFYFSNVFNNMNQSVVDHQQVKQDKRTFYTQIKFKIIYIYIQISAYDVSANKCSNINTWIRQMVISIINKNICNVSVMHSISYWWKEKKIENTERVSRLFKMKKKKNYLFMFK